MQLYKGNLLLEDADDEHIQLTNELKDIGKGKKPSEKRSSLKNAGLLISAIEKILNNFKGKLFPIKNREPVPEPEPEVFSTPKPRKEQAKKCQSKFNGDFFDKTAQDKY